jgi:hypothetical protein
MNHIIKQPDISGLNNALGKALRNVLRPVVRLMIQNNVPIKVFIEEAKAIYVDVAQENIEKEKSKVTDSQISIMTGVHRKDVKKIREDSYKETGAGKKNSLAAELIASWLGNPKTVDKEGHPLPLPYMNKEDRNFSFTGLAESIYTDVRPRALLDEFIRQGVLVEDKEAGLVTLVIDAFVPKVDSEEKLFYLGKNCGDHLAVAVNNVMGCKPLLFDRSAYSDGLSLASVDEIKKLTTEASMDMLHMVNRRTFELAEQDKGKPDAKYRVNIGAYFYTDMPEEADIQGTDSKSDEP